MGATPVKKPTAIGNGKPVRIEGTLAKNPGLPSFHDPWSPAPFAAAKLGLLVKVLDLKRKLCALSSILQSRAVLIPLRVGPIKHSPRLAGIP